MISLLCMGSQLAIQMVDELPHRIHLCGINSNSIMGVRGNVMLQIIGACRFNRSYDSSTVFDHILKSFCKSRVWWYALLHTLLIQHQPITSVRHKLMMSLPQNDKWRSVKQRGV